MPARNAARPALDRRRLRALVGTRVAVLTPAGRVLGVLHSVTARSVWLVDGDEDRIISAKSVWALTASPELLTQ